MQQQQPTLFPQIKKCYIIYVLSRSWPPYNRHILNIYHLGVFKCLLYINVNLKLCLGKMRKKPRKNSFIFVCVPFVMWVCSFIYTYKHPMLLLQASRYNAYYGKRRRALYLYKWVKRRGGGTASSATAGKREDIYNKYLKVWAIHFLAEIEREPWIHRWKKNDFNHRILINKINLLLDYCRR